LFYLVLSTRLTGQVFAIVINEAVGDNIFAYNSPISSDSFEELARSRVRCFVLVSSGRRSEFSFAWYVTCTLQKMSLLIE
jgi:hypothetical protein